MTDYAINQPPRGNYVKGMERILSMPRFSVYRSATLSIPSGVTTAIPWDTFDYDTDGMTAVDPLTGYFATCHTAGLYDFKAWGVWAANASSFRQIQFSKNGGQLYGNIVVTTGTNALVGQVITAHIPLVAGDQVDVVVAQNTGGGLALTPATSADRENGFQACLISL